MSLLKIEANISHHAYIGLLRRWYFDAVSTSTQNESITIVFYEAGVNSLSIAGVPLLYAVISGSFFNGTLFYKAVPAGKEITIDQRPDRILGTGMEQE